MSKIGAGGGGHGSGKGTKMKSTPAGRHFAPGKAVDGATLGGAVDELYHQHPHSWNSLGPHHTGYEGEIHEPHPYSGKKPSAGRAGKSPALGSKG